MIPWIGARRAARARRIFPQRFQSGGLALGGVTRGAGSHVRIPCTTGRDPITPGVRYDKDHEQTAWDKGCGGILCGCRDAIFAVAFVMYLVFCVIMISEYGGDEIHSLTPEGIVVKMHAAKAVRSLFGPISACIGVSCHWLAASMIFTASSTPA